MNEKNYDPNLQLHTILLEKSAEKFNGGTGEMELFTITNKYGIVIQITNYGGKIVRIFTPDRNGHLDDIVLGYDTIAEYLVGNPYFGALCGRYANRIAKGNFSIDGINYQLPINNVPNSLHSGPEGFNQKVFDAQVIDNQKVRLTYMGKDGEMGFPGNLTFHVTYILTDQNELCIEYEAGTDKATHVNICSHSFFNLAGEGNGDILNHELMINAKKFTPVDKFMIPTGEFSPVHDTPMDFTHLTPIGTRINSEFEQLILGNGYDHNWILDKNPNELGLAAVCYEPVTGRMIEVYTTQPGMQLYTGNWLDGKDKGKRGNIYEKRSALCLETQHFPDSPNKNHFPSTLLRPGELYKQECIYKFLVK